MVGHLDWGSAPAVQFPELFHCALNQNSVMSSYVERVGNNVVWCPTFRRNLTEVQFLAPLMLLTEVYVPIDGRDSRVWTCSTDGIF